MSMSPTLTGHATTVASPTPTPTHGAVLGWVRRVVLASWVALAALVLWGVHSGVLTSVGHLQDVLTGLGPWALLAYLALGAAEPLFPVVPGSATVLAGPLLFGPVVGTLAAYAATCLGSTAVFVLSRHLGPDLLAARFRPETVDRYLRWLDHRHATRWFAVAIAFPVAPDDLLCYLAGLSRMRMRTFIVIILLLKPWALIIYSFGVLSVLERLIPWLAS